MRHRVTALALVLAMTALLLLTGCGAAGGVEEPSQDSSASEEVPVQTEPEPEPEPEAEEEEPEELPEESEVEIIQMEEEEEPESEDETLEVTPSHNGALRVVDGQLTDSTGQAVQLRGVSTHGIGWYPEYVNEDCFEELRSWGANVVRLAMYTAEYNGYCTGGDQEALKDLIRKGVEYATNADLYVLIDWHILSDGDPNTYLSQALAFFDEMSAEFADRDNVLYEICNEPNGSATWSDIKSYAQQVIPVIRANDPDAVIIVGTPTWSQDVDQAAADPIEGWDNLMYALHFYAATHKDDLRGKLTSAVQAGLPVFVTEYGICDASGSGGIDEDSANSWVDTMDQLGVSYIAWNLSNKDETSAILRSTVTKTSGFTREDLSDSGVWLCDMLDAHRDGEVTTTQDTVQASEPEETRDSGNALAAGTSDTNGMAVSLSLQNSWSSEGRYYYQFIAQVENQTGSSVSSWQVTLRFSDDIQLSDGWNGEYAVLGSTLTIRSASYNGSLANGESTGDVGFILSSESSGLTLQQ